MNLDNLSNDRVRVVVSDAEGETSVEIATPIRVVICDDHRLFVDALAVVLAARGCEIVGKALHPDQAVEAVSSGHADICVMDMSFPNSPDCDGLEGIRRIAAASPSTRVVLLTGSADSSVAGPAIEAGARGFARKDDDLDRIVQTIKQVHAGETVGANLTTRRSWASPNGRRPNHTPAQNLARFLTSREREVLERLVRGESTATLARGMDVSYHTARTHIQNVLAKLGVHSKLEAVAFAVNHSVVSVTSEASESLPVDRAAQG
jgi:two-component system, NarL family, nitrate/nitrite response regulator NarL